MICKRGGQCIDSVCEFAGECKYTELGAKLNPKPRIPEFIELLEQSKAIHLKKNADYASDNNPFSNFERSSELLKWFKNEQDKGFIGLIGTKLARIAELSDGRSVSNESVDDSFLDLLTYVGLWAAYRKRHPYSSKQELVLGSIIPTNKI